MRRILFALILVFGALALTQQPAAALPNIRMQPFHTASSHATLGYQYGYRPVDLQKAYKAQAATGAPTVAVVVAYDSPNAEADLATYRAQFGLPPCTKANGCFRKVNQRGGSVYPAADTGWADEAMLDIEMVSAICPNCKILLVEADDDLLINLFTGVEYAATQTKFISNSWGTDEFEGEDTAEPLFNKPGVTMAFSTGDSGYGVAYPAASTFVVAVGGTSLHIDGNGNRVSETAWSGAGHGCSAYIAKPAWQANTGCSTRAVADVSAVADPDTGVAVYSSYDNGGWFVMGGTSAAAPIITGLYAAGWTPSPSTLFDAGTLGYDGPTGYGAPNGINKPPVVASLVKSCAGNLCTIGAPASDPEGKPLKFAWTLGVSTTRVAKYAFASPGTKTITVGVSDGVKTTYASKTVLCATKAGKLVCA